MRYDASLYKKKVVVLIALVFIAAFLGFVPVSKELRRVAFAATPTVAIAGVVTITPTAGTPTLTPTPTSLPPTSTFTAVPPTPTATPTVLPTTTPTSPPPPTATPTSTATPTPSPSPTPTATPTPPTPTIPVNPSLSDELAVPKIVAPDDGLETTEGKVTIEGSAPAGAVVIVYDGDTPLGIVTADTEGNWQLEPEKPLAAGKRVLTARTTDGSRVSRPSAAVRVVVIGELLPVTGGERP